MLRPVTRRSLSLPTLLLWLLMALLPLRSVASAWMATAPVPVAASAVDLPCHAAADAGSADPDTSGQTNPAQVEGAAGIGQGSCHHCDLCHSPTLVSSLPDLAPIEAVSGSWRAPDARVQTGGQQPQRRPPRS